MSKALSIIILLAIIIGGWAVFGDGKKETRISNIRCDITEKTETLIVNEFFPEFRVQFSYPESWTPRALADRPHGPADHIIIFLCDRDKHISMKDITTYMQGLVFISLDGTPGSSYQKRERIKESEIIVGGTVVETLQVNTSDAEDFSVGYGMVIQQGSPLLPEGSRLEVWMWETSEKIPEAFDRMVQSLSKSSKL